MEYLEHITRYVRSEYRLMQVQSKIDNELARGTVDEVIVARENALSSGVAFNDMYIQAHYPNGHPDFPGAGSCWIKHNLLTGGR
jgi:hypothetical protein